jgi:hypothetical protein
MGEHARLFVLSTSRGVHRILFGLISLPNDTLVDVCRLLGVWAVGLHSGRISHAYQLSRVFTRDCCCRPRFRSGCRKITWRISSVTRSRRWISMHFTPATKATVGGANRLIRG